MQIGVEAQESAAHCRIFVLDDDDINRTVLQFMLSAENDSREFTSVAAAVSAGQERPPDLVLLSALMLAREHPGLIGRMRDAWPGVGVIVLCEAAEGDCVAAAKSAGADDTLMRPFRIEPVRRKVKRQLARKALTPVAIDRGAQRLSL